MEMSLSAPGIAAQVGRFLHACSVRLAASWRSQRKTRSLVIQETAGLGERRFVAVVQFERQRFLIGGSAGSVTLLTLLPDQEERKSTPE
jgi:flagellar biogenesis protein FliO